jgi:hypothetical protein
MLGKAGGPRSIVETATPNHLVTAGGAPGCTIRWMRRAIIAYPGYLQRIIVVVVQSFGVWKVDDVLLPPSPSIPAIDYQTRRCLPQISIAQTRITDVKMGSRLGK